MIYSFIKRLFFRDGVGPVVIPIGIARLCINCENIIKEPVCPVCGSKQNILIGKVLGVSSLLRFKKSSDEVPDNFKISLDFTLLSLLGKSYARELER